MKARDQRIPEKVGQGIVTISIIRDGSPPEFIGEPYGVNISYTTPVDTPIIAVRAQDNKLIVSPACSLCWYWLRSYLDLTVSIYL